jgi:hypothetical protein
MINLMASAEFRAGVLYDLRPGGGNRVTGAERDRSLELCREQDTPGWFQPHGSRLPEQLITHP